MDDDAEAAEGAAAFQSRDQVVGHAHPLDGAAEDEFVWVEEHRLVQADLNHLHQVVGGLLDVDEGALGVAEDQELVVEANVVARGLDEGRIEWIDPESTAGDGFVDRAIGQDHRAVAPPAGLDCSLGTTSRWLARLARSLGMLARSIRRRTSSSNDEMSANARYTDAKRMYATWSRWRSFSIARSPMIELDTSGVSRARSSASTCSTVRSIVSALIGRLVQATCRLRRSLSGFHSCRRWSLLTTISVEVSGRS